MSDDSRDYELIDRLAEEFAERFRNGERPTLQEYCERYPAIADDLREMLPALAEVEHVKDEVQSPPEVVVPKLRQVGEYSILREVGRGGMGVVYEAEQVTLGRRVALKVLAGGKSGHGLERFKREARAAARLHHTNIVPVFGVGDHEGLPYYVMQFIQGLGINEVLDEVKRLQATTGTNVPPVSVSVKAPRKDISAAAVARSLVTGTFKPPTAAIAETLTHAPDVGTDLQVCANPAGLEARRHDQASSSSSISLPGQSTIPGRKPTYWHSVAQIGLQVADALDYAHRQGVLHRDIKPSNLLLDMHGVVWVSDFGLAKADDQENLTNTGDMLGTVRYMPPEAFEGKSDGRSDVYSLGLTIYELLALRPGYDERKREQLIKQVTTTDPPRLGSLNRSIPRDLQTIVHKAIEKDPNHRYKSAGDLAADLRRFLADQPVLARRISPVERGARWCRRNPLVAGLTAAVLLLLVFVAAAATIAYLRTDAALEWEMQAHREADALRQAEENARKEGADRRDEALRLKNIAQTERDAAKDHLYLAHLHLAQQAYESSEIASAAGFLGKYLPEPEIADRRGWEWFYLDGLCHQELRQFPEQGKAGRRVSWSPDGRRLVTTQESGGPQVWDAATGKLLFVLADQNGRSFQSGWAAAWSPDGTRIAAGRADIIIWNVETKQVLRKFRAHNAFVRSLTWSPDGRRLATGSDDNSVKVWDSESGRLIHTLQGHTSYAASVAFSPDGKRLASCGWDYKLRVWDTDSGKVHHVLTGHRNSVETVAWSPDGRRVASACSDRTVRLWDPESGKEVRTHYGHSAGVNGLAFSHDGKRLASAGAEIKVWDAATGRDLQTLRGKNHRMIWSVCWSPDDRCLASASTDGVVKIWDAGREPEALTIRANVELQATPLDWSPDGNRVVSAGGWNAVKVWHARTGLELLKLEVPVEEIRSVAWSPDGKYFVATGANRFTDPDKSHDGFVFVWDASTGNEIKRFRAHDAKNVMRLAWRGDGKVLATAGGDGEIRLWDPTTWKLVQTLRGQDNANWSLAWSQDDRRLASGSINHTITIWDPTTAELLSTLTGHTGGVGAVSWNMDGSRLASASHDGSIRIWDVSEGKELRTLKGHEGAVRWVEWHRDGRRLVSAGHDRRIKIWDSLTGEEALTLRSHTNSVETARWSPDFQRLVSGSTDGTVRIWDARLPTEELRLERETISLFRSAWNRSLFKEELQENLHKAPDVSDRAREGAAALVSEHRFQENAKRLTAACMAAIRKPSDAAAHRQALRWAQAACDLEPNKCDGLHVLGALQYRLAQYKQAVATLTRAAELHAKSGSGVHPQDQAFLAMSHHQLGAREAAEAALDRLRDVIKQPKWAANADCIAIQTEAEALIGGKAEPLKK